MNRRHVTLNHCKRSVEATIEHALAYLEIIEKPLLAEMIAARAKHPDPGPQTASSRGVRAGWDQRQKTLSITWKTSHERGRTRRQQLAKQVAQLEVSMKASERIPTRPPVEHSLEALEKQDRERESLVCHGGGPGVSGLAYGAVEGPWRGGGGSEWGLGRHVLAGKGCEDPRQTGCTPSE